MRTLARVTVRLVGVTMALALLVAFAYHELQAPYRPQVPSAPLPAPASLAEAQMQDLDRFEFVLHTDRAYTPATRASALEQLAAARARLTAGVAYSPASFELLVARIASVADNGHSGSAAGPRSGRFGRIPIRLFAFASSYAVVRARAPFQDLLGARLEAVNDHPISEVEETLSQYASGRPNFRRLTIALLIESPSLLAAAGLGAGVKGATYRFHTLGGSPVIRTIEADPPEDNPPPIEWSRPLAPAPIPGERGEWSSLISPVNTPITLASPDNAFPPPTMINRTTLYAQMRANADRGAHTISAFKAAVYAAINQNRPRDLILDLRWNGGGNYTTTAFFMARLPKSLPPDGRVYAITGPCTFSAGISSLGFLKQSDPARVVIVGDAVGDRMIFHGEPISVDLPNSKIHLFVAMGLHDYQNGCHWLGPCYWVNWIFPISLPTLDPDISAPFELEELSHGIDPALVAIDADQKRRAH